MSRERLSAAVEELEAAIAERGIEVREELEAAESEARARERRYKAAKQELIDLGRRVGYLQSEVADLPLAFSSAELSGDEDEQNRLKARHAALIRELEELEERRGDLEAEVRELVLNPTPHDLDARIEGAGQVLDVALPNLRELQRAKSKIDAALTRILRPLDHQIDRLAGDLEGWQRVVLYDASQARRKRPAPTGAA